MTRKQNLMVACAVTIALASAWFFSDSVRAPFSRRGMAVPVAEEVPPPTPAPAPQEDLTPEQLEQVLAELEQRTKLARAAQDAEGAHAFLDHVREHRRLTELANKVMCLLVRENHSFEFLTARQEELERISREQLGAVHEMYRRVWAADCYGDTRLQECFAFDEAVMLSISIDEALRSLELARHREEWEQKQAEKQPAEEEQEAASLPGLIVPAEPESEGPAPQCRFAEPLAKLDWVLAVMRQRTELAYAVQDPASAQKFLQATTQGNVATWLALEMLAALDEEQEHVCDSTKAIRNRRAEIEVVMAALLAATNDLHARAVELNYFGSRELLSHYCYSWAETLSEEIEEQLPQEPDHECRYEGPSETVGWALGAMQTRTERARAVQDAESARTWLYHNQPELGGRVMALIKETMAALSEEETHDCRYRRAILAQRDELTKAWNALQQAEADMHARAAAAGNYGVAEWVEP